MPVLLAPSPLDAVFAQPTELPCHTAGPDLFFSDHRAEVEAAKALCGSCPLKAPCLAGALARAEAAGVWGGQLFVDGKVVPFKRGRGRPRKVPAA